MKDLFYGVDAFVEAVNVNSFSKAAERLHLSRSAIGKIIERLEHQLGVQLFNRTTRSLRLTDEGRVYFEYCVRAQAEMQAARAMLEEGKRELSGFLRVTAPVLFGRRCVAPVLMELIKQYPRLNLEMSLSDRVVDLQMERFDLGVRIGSLADSATLSARRLGAQNMVVCASPAYIQLHGAPSTLDQFAGRPAIVYSSEGRRAPWRIRGSDGNIVEAQVRAVVEVDDLQAIADAAVNGVGLAWLPLWLVHPYVRSGELEVIFDSDAVVATEIHAIWPAVRHLTPKTRAAIDMLRARLDDYLL